MSKKATRSKKATASSNVFDTDPATVFTGIDVSAASLAVAVQQQDKGGFQQKQFDNSAAGHKQLIAWLRKSGGKVRVTLEATGMYSLDLALALDAAQGIEVAVLNPKTAHQFAQTLCRSKTDGADAQALAQYSQRMEFVPWQPPGPIALELRSLSRHIATLTEDQTRCKNRLHAAQASANTPKCVLQDLQRSLQDLAKRIRKLREQAAVILLQDSGLKQKFEQIKTIQGIADASAVQILGELACLDPKMEVRQWVAYSGLDPVHQVSGTSVRKAPRISRHGSRYLRRALFMPAMVGVQHDPHMRSFYKLLQTRHKTKLQALMAVARKLLHAIFGIFKTGTAYDGSKLFPQLETA
jgi:transposase